MTDAKQAIQSLEVRQQPTMALDAVGRRAAIDDLLNKVALVQEVMKSVMHDGEHYGIIPGCGSKPALLKAGAEKLGMTFRLCPAFQINERDLGRAHREYSITCTLSDGTQGVGSCSTMESKYRYRQGERKCPECGKATIITGKAEYGGGFLCFAKKGGCGAKFDEKDERITGQQIGKVEHDNPADFYNCVTPETKLLTRDLQWVPAGEIESGDILVGVNENNDSQYACNFAIGDATVHGRKLDALFEIATEDGRIVRCNGEHKWLVKRIGLKGTEWIETGVIHKEMTERKGRPRHWTVMSVCQPWIEDVSKEAGYIAGLLDADGSLGSVQLTVLFAQQANTVLTLIQRALQERGYRLSTSPVKSPEVLAQCLSQKQVHSVRILGGMAEQLRLLGSIRPPRLLERWLSFWDLSTRRLEGRGSGAGSPVRIVSIKPIGEGEVVMVGTSCKTYIAEGLVCHNTCLKMGKKRAHVDAIITATACSDIFTQDVEEIVENRTANQPDPTPEPKNITPTQPPTQPINKPSSFKPQTQDDATLIPVCTVKMVTERQGTSASGKAWKAYFILLNDGFEDMGVATFSGTVADAAKSLSESGENAEATIKPGRKPGSKELVSILPKPSDKNTDDVPH